MHVIKEQELENIEEHTGETTPADDVTLNGGTSVCEKRAEARDSSIHHESDQENEAFVAYAASTGHIPTRGVSRFQLPINSPQQSNQSTASVSGGATALIESASPRVSVQPLNNTQAFSQKSWARRVQNRAAEVRQLFRLGSGEQLMEDYMCALRKKVLLQGRLFIFERHFCFYSSLFGYHKTKVIPLESIQDISKKKNVGFPNSIQVIWNAGTQGGIKKEFFTSFLSREEAYRLMLGLWGRCSDIGKERAAAELGPSSDAENDGDNTTTINNVSVTASATTAQISRSGLSKRWSQWGRSSMNGPSTSSMAQIFPVKGGSDEDEEERSTRQSRDHTAADGNNSWIGRSVSPVPINGNANTNTLSDNDDVNLPSSSTTHNAATNNANWALREFEDGPTCDDASVIKEFQTATEPAPSLPSTMQRILKCNLPTSPYGFYHAFLCPSSDFFISFHESQGHTNIELSPWQRHYKVGPVRDLRFVSPIKGWRFGPAQALCHQTQRFKVHSNNHLVFETSQVMNDIPYGDHFRVDQRWDVAPGSNPDTCTLEVHIAVPFTKSTMLKKIIERSVTDSTLEAFRMFKELADKQLEGMQREEEHIVAEGGTPVTRSPAPPPAVGVGMSVPSHRRNPSRPSSPEEALPANNEEWEVLLSQVEPQWRGGLRALRRMQLNATAVSPLPGGPRHRRRGSRASRGGASAFDFAHGGGSNQNLSTLLIERQHSGNNGMLLAGGMPPSPQLPSVPEKPVFDRKSKGIFSSLTTFFKQSFLGHQPKGQRTVYFPLCVLLFVIVCLQAVLIVSQWNQCTNGDGKLTEGSGGGGGVGDEHASRDTIIAMSKQIAALKTQVQRLQKEAQSWASAAEAAAKTVSDLAAKIKHMKN